MTEETKKRLPGIIERIDDLQNEVDKIFWEEFNEFSKKRDALDKYGRIMASRRVKRLTEARKSLVDASRLLKTFRRNS